jgi:hypothetical protein
MAVIINELEVVVEPAPEAGAEEAESTAAVGSTPRPLTPLDLADIFERRRRIDLRTWAH